MNRSTPGPSLQAPNYAAGTPGLSIDWRADLSRAAFARSPERTPARANTLLFDFYGIEFGCYGIGARVSAALRHTPECCLGVGTTT